MSNQAQAPEFFNLHVNGIGYLNRVRWVDVKGQGRKAEPFLACSISALRGHSDETSYTYFDLRVSGDEAIELISSLEESANNGKKVLVNFRIGDIYPHTYERQIYDENRRPTGQYEWSSLIKGRLILIHSIKVDGEVVYRRSANEESQSSQAEHAQEFAPAHVAERTSQRQQPAQRPQRTASQNRPAYA